MAEDDINRLVAPDAEPKGIVPNADGLGDVRGTRRHTSEVPNDPTKAMPKSLPTDETLMDTQELLFVDHAQREIMLLVSKYGAPLEVDIFRKALKQAIDETKRVISHREAEQKFLKEMERRALAQLLGNSDNFALADDILAIDPEFVNKLKGMGYEIEIN